jgi:hypothetical protein
MEIEYLVGTCSNEVIADFASCKKYTRSKSWVKAKKMIFEYSEELYYSLALQYRTYYEDHTVIKRGCLQGVDGDYLVIVHSAVDYVFKLKSFAKK